MKHHMTKEVLIGRQPLEYAQSFLINNRKYVIETLCLMFNLLIYFVIQENLLTFPTYGVRI